MDFSKLSKPSKDLLQTQVPHNGQATSIMGLRRSTWKTILVCALTTVAILTVLRFGNFTQICSSDPDDGFYKEDITQESNSEQRHVVYVRIPKTGSSTVTMLLWRFAWTRMLKVLSVKPGCEGTQNHLYAECFFLPPKGTKFDIMAEHVFFDSVSYERYFNDKTAYVTLLREPLNMLQSTVYYMQQFRDTLQGEDKVASYLKNPGGYDYIIRHGGRSYTRNPQSSYFGLNYQHFKNEKKIQEIISEIELNFPVVMILEKLDESLILLRRVIEWPMKDLIYVTQNVNKNNPRFPVSKEGREKYRQWSLADHMLYEHFLEKLESEIAKLGKDFETELTWYRKYKEEVNIYCRFQIITDEVLYIPKTDYNEAFTVNRKDCVLMNVEPLVLISNIRKRQFSFPFLSAGLKLDIKN